MPRDEDLPVKKQHLAKSRTAAAVKWLEEDTTDTDVPPPKVRGPVHDAPFKPRSGRRGWVNEPVGKFQLRADDPPVETARDPHARAGHESTSASAGPSQGSTGLGMLRELFQGAFDADVLASVLAQCDNDVARATEALLSFGAPSTSGASAPPGTPQPPPSQATGPPLWAALPEDCKLEIAARLSSRDLARVARVSREFARLADTRRRRANFVQAPRGLSFTALAGMIMSHPNASKLILTRMAPDLRHIVHFEDIAAAIGAAVDSPKRTVPISHLQLRRCDAVDHDAVAALLANVPGVHELDFADCGRFDDDALTIVSQHLPASAFDCHSGLDGLSLHDDPTVLDAETAAHTKWREGPDLPRPQVAGRPVVSMGSVILSPAVQELVDASGEAESSAPETAVAAADAAGPSEPSADTDGTPRARLPAGVTDLRLKGCSVGDKGIAALFKASSACRSTLSSLDISHCSGVTHRSLGDLPPASVLASLKAEACKGIGHLTLALPSQHPLADINLLRMPSLQELDLKLDNLTTLTVSFSKMLTSIRLRTPKLRSLMANQCSHLTDLQAHVPMRVLHHINLMGCNDLPSQALTHTLPLTPCLTRLNIAACLALTVVIVPAEVPLEYLDVNGSFVQGLHVRSTALRVLDGRACRYLETVSLASRPLALDLGNCERLESLGVGRAPEWEGGVEVERRARLCNCPRLSKHAVAGVQQWATLNNDCLRLPPLDSMSTSA